MERIRPRRDGFGRHCDDRGIVQAGCGGYLYLQGDPDPLTLGLLQRTP
jgi:hypothetical protein